MCVPVLGDSARRGCHSKQKLAKLHTEESLHTIFLATLDGARIGNAYSRVLESDVDDDDDDEMAMMLIECDRKWHCQRYRIVMENLGQ